MLSGLWKTVQLILEDLFQNDKVETGIEIYSQSHSLETMTGNDIENFRIQTLSIYLWALTNSKLMLKTTRDKINPEAIYVGLETASKHNEVIIKTTGCHRAKDTPTNDQCLHPCESGVLTIMDFIQTALPPIYKHTSFVKDEYRNYETCLRTRLKVAKFIRFMYVQHMMLHNSLSIPTFQNIEKSIYISALHESLPGKFRIITDLVAAIDPNTSTTIHTNDRMEKIPEDLKLDIHTIDDLMSTNELQSHHWFENSNELKRLSKFVRAKAHPDKFASSNEDIQNKASS